MITATEHTNHEESRYNEASLLIESSTYDHDQRDQLYSELNNLTADGIDEMIENLLMNQLDRFDIGSPRLKDINRKLDYHAKRD